MVMRFLFLLQRGIVFVVHADQAGGAQRGEDRRPRADDDVGRAGLNAAPLAQAHGGGQAAVDLRDTIGPAGEAQRRQRRRAADFR